MKYIAMQNTTDWIRNSSKEEFLEGFKQLGDNYSGPTLVEAKMLTQQEAFQALLYGENLQCRHPDGDSWVEVKDANMLLDESLKFRIAPRVIKANGIEIPSGYRGKMTKGQAYFLPALHARSCYDSAAWDGGDYDTLMMKRGLVFLTKEDAVACAKAIISLGGGDSEVV